MTPRIIMNQEADLTTRRLCNVPLVRRLGSMGAELTDLGQHPGLTLHGAGRVPLAVFVG